MHQRTIVAIAGALALALPATAQGFDPAEAVDINPSSTIVEVNLTASATTHQYLPGQTANVYAYNGQIPGPTIRANVGDLLIVHFTNNLPEATTIHWHGVDLPGIEDGSHISQLHVQPGATYDYQFVLPRPGMYWYHPHVRTFDQVELGLHGVLLVDDPVRDAALGLDTIEEHIVVFDDILLDSNGDVVPAFSFTDPLQNATYHLNGREGNHLLVNGKKSDTVVLPVANGAPQRWHILNAANTTFARLDADVADIGTNYWMGTDGHMLESPAVRLPVTAITPPTADHPRLFNDREAMLLVPGERMEVIFTPRGTAGATIQVEQFDWPRGRHAVTYGMGGMLMVGDDPLDGFYPEQDYFQLQLVGADPGDPYYTPPTSLGDIVELDPASAIGTLTPVMGHAVPAADGSVVFFTQRNMVMTPMGMMMMPLPAKLMDPLDAFDVNVGETWIWEVQNLTHGDHPFHVHGFTFQPYEIEYVDTVNFFNEGKFPIPVTMEKDTIRVPPRPGAKMSSWTFVRAVTKFDDTGRVGQIRAEGETPTFDTAGNYVSGGWLFHCHILEHSGVGMLSFFEVHDPAEPFWSYGKELNGTNGKASLTGSSTLAAGAPVTLDMVNALSGAGTMLAIGFSQVNLPFAGGTFVPSPDILDFSQTVDGSGMAQWNYTWPTPAIASGTELYFQVWFLDAGAPMGAAASNAIQLIVP